MLYANQTGTNYPFTPQNLPFCTMKHQNLTPMISQKVMKGNVSELHKKQAKYAHKISIIAAGCANARILSHRLLNSSNFTLKLDIFEGFRTVDLRILGQYYEKI